MPLLLSIYYTGEDLESGIRNALLLQSDEAVVVTAQEEFEDVLPDGKRVKREGGREAYNYTRIPVFD